MKITKQIMMLMVVVVACGYPGAASALLRDKEEGKWSLLGQFKAQATFRMEDAPPNSPIPLEAGDMTSQRNLLLLEWKHDLGERWYGIKSEYQLKGRAFYDGAWDYGPNVMTDDDVRYEYCLENRDQINDEKRRAEIFNAYVDLTKGPVFTRIGRQVMSWGEMSTIRILDGTNPLDTSSLAVDLQERLIPLWMVRANLAFDVVGPFESMSIGGYYVPGKIDNTYEQTMIDGSPIIPTIGRDTRADLANPFSMASLKQFINMEDSAIDKDRYGVKLGMLYKGLDLNLVYYRMYSDLPVPQIDVEAIQPITVNPMEINMKNPLGSILGDQKLTVVKAHDVVDVFGTSFNFNISAINTVVRGEAAYFKDVPKMPPGYLTDLISALSPKVTIKGISGSLEDLVKLFPLGNAASMVLPFTAGEIPKYDVVKYGIGLDKWVKVSAISKDDILLTFEYVGSKTLDYKRHAIIQPWYAPWDDDHDGQYDTVWEPEYSNTFILIGRTNYLNGNLVPQVVTMYEAEPQALVLLPSVKYSRKKLDFELSYFFTVANGYEGTLGMLQDRDEISFSITYNF